MIPNICLWIKKKMKSFQPLQSLEGNKTGLRKWKNKTKQESLNNPDYKNENPYLLCSKLKYKHSSSGA